MLFIFFLGNKLCDEEENEEIAASKKVTNIREQSQPGDAEQADYNKGKSLREMYCSAQNEWTMNAGVVFLCMAAFRAYFNKISGKMDKA